MAATGASVAATPISGTYRGELTSPTGAILRLDLRIDVDPLSPRSPVLKRLSGDLFRVDRRQVGAERAREVEVYQESWIVDEPNVEVLPDATSITGALRSWTGSRGPTTVRVRVPRQPPRTAAEVSIEAQGMPALAFTCRRLGPHFRSLHLQLDVCQSVEAEPTRPRYGTRALQERPADLPGRLLTLEKAYAEAGIDLKFREDRKIVIDDSAIEGWKDAELHNAMEHHFARAGGPWPQWEMWGLLAGRYDEELVGGLMFDYAGADGADGRSPQRRGFAVFRGHYWFEPLVEKPTTAAQHEAARKFLWSFVHESGHAFNLLHSFDKERESSLSWMNYDWKYDGLHGDGAYWSAFPFVFDPEELLHIRHGARSSVIMGGDPWSSGGHAESAPGTGRELLPPWAMTTLSGEAPLELAIRAESYFEFLEPVSVELRLRNLLPVPLTVRAALHPELGGVSVYIRRPDGRIVEYEPLTCKLSREAALTLAPAGAADGTDRSSRSVFLSYGRNGYCFDEPGQYSVRAVFHGAGGLVIPSNVQRLRIGHPRNAEEDRRAQDFFSYEAGAALYLGGSQSSFLSYGMDTLQTMIEERGDDLARAKTAARIARGVGLPFHDLDVPEPNEEPAQTIRPRRTKGDPQLALRLTETAARAFRRHRNPRLCFALERVVRTRADLLEGLGETERAQKTLQSLAGELDKQGVKESVVAKVRSDAARVGRVRKRTTKRSPSATKGGKPPRRS